MKQISSYHQKTPLINNFRLKKIPKKYRDDLNKFYSFIVATDNIIYSENGLSEFKYIIRRWQSIKKDDLFGSYVRLDDSVNEFIISDISYLVHRFDLNSKDVDDYFRSIAISLRNKEMYNSSDFVRYLQYSAESPAVMVTKILEFPNALVHHAKMQARALKLLQMLLAIGNETNREKLFPLSELKKYSLKSLDKNNIEANHKGFSDFIDLQIKRYRAWNEEARKGDEFLPKKIRQQVKNMRTTNDFLVDQISKNSMNIYKLKERPPLKVKIKSKLKK